MILLTAEQTGWGFVCEAQALLVFSQTTNSIWFLGCISVGTSEMLGRQSSTMAAWVKEVLKLGDAQWAVGMWRPMRTSQDLPWASPATLPLGGGVFFPEANSPVSCWTWWLWVWDFCRWNCCYCSFQKDPRVSSCCYLETEVSREHGRGVHRMVSVCHWWLGVC